MEVQSDHQAKQTAGVLSSAVTLRESDQNSRVLFITRQSDRAGEIKDLKFSKARMEMLKPRLLIDFDIILFNRLHKRTKDTWVGDCPGNACHVQAPVRLGQWNVLSSDICNFEAVHVKKRCILSLSLYHLPLIGCVLLGVTTVLGYIRVIA